MRSQLWILYRKLVVSFMVEWAPRVFSRSQIQTGTICVATCITFCQQGIEHICKLVKEAWQGRRGHHEGLAEKLAQEEG
jgi:hypothetical protein